MTDRYAYGVIKGVEKTSVRVETGLSIKTLVVVQASRIEMERPDVDDYVVAFQGPHRGTSGLLCHFDGEDVVIQMKDGIFKSVAFTELVKIDNTVYPGHIVGEMPEETNQG